MSSIAYGLIFLDLNDKSGVLFGLHCRGKWHGSVQTWVELSSSKTITCYHFTFWFETATSITVVVYLDFWASLILYSI
ncbi:hypothetical protein RJT34_30233 [Clitoria ternatea]|uniref:Uncharacterized protein n=1 Tax=Clitoria ternatea TaxID=43366 RepID=A0AAN9I075_CLITE